MCRNVYTNVLLPASSGNNTLSEKVYFEEREKITFSATGDGAESGTYVVTTLDNGIYEAGDEFTFTTEIETGSYSWDENSQTVILKPEKAIWDKRGSSSGGTGTIEIEIDYGPLVDRVAYRNDLQAEWNKMAAGMPQAEISAELSSMGFSSITDYVNYIVDEAFSNRSYTYSLSTGTYNLSWGVTNTSYSMVRSTIYEQDWDVRESTSSGSLADCFNFSNDGISAPRGLKTVSKINSGNVPLAGVFDGGSYAVLFYLTKK